MLRRKTIVLAVIISAAAVAATETYFWLYVDRGPTSEEVRIYGVFLKHFETERQLRPKEVALLRTTLQLTAPKFDRIIPQALRPDKMLPPPEFVSFCGEPCGRDFVRKNLIVWQLQPSVQSEIGVALVEASEDKEIPEKRLVEVTRVGFNLWRNRAVLLFSSDCNDYSPLHPVVCVEMGKAYLRKRNGTWAMEDWEIIHL